MPSQRNVVRGALGIAPFLIPGIALMAYALDNLGVTIIEAVRASFILLLAFAPLGFALTRGLDDGLSRGERLVLALLVGYPVASTLYYLLSRADAEIAFFPIEFGMCAAFWLARDRAPHVEVSPAPGPGAPRILLVLVPLILLVTTRFSRAFLAGDEGLVYSHSTDHSLHLSFYWELLRGVPPSQIPTAAGLTFPTYHFLAFMPGLLLIQTAGFDALSVYHAVGPLLKASLLMGALYLALRIRTGSHRTAAAALAIMFLVAATFENSWNESFVVGPSPYYDLLRNEAEGGGLIVWAIIACLLTLHDRARAERSGDGAARLLLLASLFAGLSYGFKAQLFLLFAGAFFAALGCAWWRHRSWLPVQSMGMAGLAFGLLFVASRVPGAFASPQWTPGLFAELYIYPNLPLGAARDLLLSLPGNLPSLVAVLLAVWRIVDFSPLVPVYLGHSLRRARAIGLVDSWLGLAFLLALPMGFGFSVVSFYKEPSPFEFRQAAHGLAIAGVAISVATLHEVARRFGKDPDRVVPLVTGLAMLAAAPFLASQKPFVPARAGIVVSPDEQCALLFLRERTAATAVVASARTLSFVEPQRSPRLNHQAVVAGFAGRRSVLEFYGKEVDWNRDRERDIRRLFVTGNQDRAEEILKAYDVDYVLENRRLPLNFSKDALRLVFERGDYRIYHTAFGSSGGPRGLEEVPEVFRRGRSLSCPLLTPDSR